MFRWQDPAGLRMSEICHKKAQKLQTIWLTLVRIFCAFRRRRFGPFCLGLRAQTDGPPIVVIVELSRKTVRCVRIRSRKLRSVSQSIELVLAVQQYGAIDIHDRGAVNTRTHEAVQFRRQELGRHIEEWIARHLLLAVDRRFIEQVDGTRAVGRRLDVVGRTHWIALRHQIPNRRIVGP